MTSSAAFLRSESESSASRGLHGERTTSSMDVVKADQAYGARTIGGLSVNVDTSGRYGDDGLGGYGVGAGVLGDKYALSVSSSSPLMGNSLRKSSTGNGNGETDKDRDGGMSMYNSEFGYSPSVHRAHGDSGTYMHIYMERCSTE